MGIIILCLMHIKTWVYIILGKIWVYPVAAVIEVWALGSS